MQELRLVAVSEDGSYAVLVVPGRSGRFALPIDERLRTVARGQFSRLAQYEIEVESPLRPKEIQDRIRAGETAEEIADAAGLPVERIRRFEGPVLAEREFRAKEAQQATVRGRESGPGPRLGEVVTARLSEAGASVDDVDWDSRKRQDGNWQVQLAYTVAGRMHMAEWIYDPRSKHVIPDDDEAIRLCLSEAEWPEPRQLARGGTTATVTPIGSRAGLAGSYQQDPRTQSDRSAGQEVLHPSRQGLTGGAAASSVQSQISRAGRVAGQVGEGAHPAKTAAAAGGMEMLEPAGLAGRRDDGGDRDTAGSLGRDVAVSGARVDGAGQDPAKPAATDAQAARPARRGNGRARRSSVPSWDEIMFGNSRQPD